jgi:hypothetical protein
MASACGRLEDVDVEGSDHLLELRPQVCYEHVFDGTPRV